MFINKEKTQYYYKNNYRCTCADCKNFYIQFKSKYESIYDYLKRLGVNPLRPFELVPVSLENGTVSYICQYVVMGSCTEDVIASIGDIEITLCRGHHPETDIDEEHFVIDFGPIILEDYSLKINKLLEIIDIYNRFNKKKDYNTSIKEFCAIIDYVEDLQKINLIETENVNISRKYIIGLLEEETEKVIRFKDSITNNIYEISLNSRDRPDIRIVNVPKKTTFLDLIRYEKDKMNPIRFKTNYIFIPVWLALFFINIIIIFILDSNNDNLSLVSYILLGIDIVSLPIWCFLIPFIRKKEVGLEFKRYDFVNTSDCLIYEFEDASSVYLNNIIEFKEDRIIVNKKSYSYDNCVSTIVTDNDFLRVNVKILFTIIDDGDEYNIPIMLDGNLIKLIEEKKIKIVDREKYDYIIHNKEKAFYQIIKYGIVKKYK